MSTSTSKKGPPRAPFRHPIPYVHLSPILTLSLHIPDNTLVTSRRLGETNIQYQPSPAFYRLLPPDVFSFFTSRPSTRRYLLRRLADNLIFATCLFRAVFPYANADEKIREFKHLRKIWMAGIEKSTGDVWVTAKQAVRLGGKMGLRGGLLRCLMVRR